MSEQRRILVTAALPYANGPAHIGHIVEQCYTDFWVRFQKLRGHDCHFICADDTHGTPIMLKAREREISPEELIKEYQEEHSTVFRDFEIDHAFYSSTHTTTNHEISSSIFKKMEEQNHIEKRSTDQFYCVHDTMFLPDRFVKGTCPRCGATDQNGDSCDKCGATYEPVDVKDPYCSICRNPPELRQTDNLFFMLSHFREFLATWVKEHTPKEIHGKLNDWLAEGELQDWCISRDKPYFGFPIPGHPDKFFYVWLDAPVGYISTTKTWCEKVGKSFDTYWHDQNTEIYHVIGKDIISFHTLFWPAMLKVAGFNLPDHIFVHGFLTVNGEKMSKSKGTFIPARIYLNHLDATYMRYYLACKMGSGIDDFDFSYDDFTQRVNSDLIGKITNIASRGAQMTQKRLDGKMGVLPADGQELIAAIRAESDKIADLYEKRNFGKVMLAVRDLATLTNKYFDEREPWKTIKDDPETVRGILTTILNAFRLMAIYLKPILPSYVAKVEALFKEDPYTWDSLQTIVENTELAPFSHLAARIDRGLLDKITDETKEVYGVAGAEAAAAKEQKGGKKVEKTTEGDASQDTKWITFDEFAKVQLRVGKVIEAAEVPKANKLLQLTVDVGEDKPRNIFSGIKAWYEPADLVGKKVVVVTNLAPRKMKFGMSEGMVIASGDKDVKVLFADASALPGDEVS